MDVLYFWRRDNYQRDQRFGFGYHLNQNSPVLSRVQEGDTVWAFTRDSRGRYVLAAALVVRAVTRNPPSYGAEELIRQLKLTARARNLGQSFQGPRAVRPLGSSDSQLMAEFSAELPGLERVGIYPEDEFEARLLLGADVRKLLIPDGSEAYAVRMRYLFDTVNVTRARRHVQWLQKRYGGRCQICLFDPRARYDRGLCHGHHIQWLSRGGEDSVENMVLICPNHHTAVHQADAVFDYADLTFRFSNGLIEGIQLNRHLRPAA